jgi:aspartyl-tRNA(Asn)/glutamyl-tRNA(Gln) amidotransferase subunit A
VGDPIQMYLNDIFTVPVNMAGLPGISVPAGLSLEGTPLGLQLIGPAFGEPTLFRAAQVIEDAAGRFSPPEPWWNARGVAAESAPEPKRAGQGQAGKTRPKRPARRSSKG